MILGGEGVELLDVKLCGGPVVSMGSTISLLYKVALSEEDLSNGRLLESNYSPDVPLICRVDKNELLAGIVEGLIGMRSGGSVRRLRIPPALAYGQRGAEGVPPGADLWVELCVSRILPSENTIPLLTGDPNQGAESGP